MTTTPRKAAVKKAPARKRTAKTAAPKLLAVDSHDQAEETRRAAVRDALDQIVGGPLPYRPDRYTYRPDPDYALAILTRSMMQCYRMTNPRPPEGTP